MPREMNSACTEMLFKPRPFNLLISILNADNQGLMKIPKLIQSNFVSKHNIWNHHYGYRHHHHYQFQPILEFLSEIYYLL